MPLTVALIGTDCEEGPDTIIAKLRMQSLCTHGAGKSAVLSDSSARQVHPTSTGGGTPRLLFTIRRLSKLEDALPPEGTKLSLISLSVFRNSSNAYVLFIRTKR